MKATLTNEKGETRQVEATDDYYPQVMLRAVVEGQRIPIQSTPLPAMNYGAGIVQTEAHPDGDYWSAWRFVAVTLDTVTIMDYEAATAQGKADSQYLYQPAPTCGNLADELHPQIAALVARLRDRNGRTPCLGHLETYIRAILGEIRVVAQPLRYSPNTPGFWAAKMGGYSLALDH